MCELERLKSLSLYTIKSPLNGRLLAAAEARDRMADHRPRAGLDGSHAMISARIDGRATKWTPPQKIIINRCLSLLLLLLLLCGYCAHLEMMRFECAFREATAFKERSTTRGKPHRGSMPRPLGSRNSISRVNIPFSVARQMHVIAG